MRFVDDGEHADLEALPIPVVKSGSSYGLELVAPVGAGVALKKGGRFTFENLEEIFESDLKPSISLTEGSFGVILVLKTQSGRYCKCFMSVSQGNRNEDFPRRMLPYSTPQRIADVELCVVSQPNDPFVGYPSPAFDMWLAEGGILSQERQ